MQKLFWAIEAYYETPLLEEWTSYLFDRLVRDKDLFRLSFTISRANTVMWSPMN